MKNLLRNFTLVVISFLTFSCEEEENKNLMTNPAENQQAFDQEEVITSPANKWRWARR